jgi:hypothetical protein
LLKLSSIILFALLSISPFLNFDSYGTSEIIYYENLETNEKSLENNLSSIISKDYKIELTDNVSIASNDKSRDFELVDYKSFVKNNLALFDKVEIIADDPEQYELLKLVKHNDEEKMIMERIIQNDRKNPNKYSLIDNYFNHELLSTDQTNNLNSFEQLQISNLEFILEANSSKLLFDSFDIFTNNFENNVKIISSEFLLLSYDDIATIQYSLNDPTILFLLIPFAGIIFLRAENVQFNKLKYSSLRALPLLVILIASLGITPLSISSSYWGPNYAYGDNSTENLVSNLTNETTSMIPTNVTSVLSNLTNETTSMIPTSDTSVLSNSENSTVLDDLTTVFSFSETHDSTFDSVSITDKISLMITESASLIMPDPGTKSDSVSITDKIRLAS